MLAGLLNGLQKGVMAGPPESGLPSFQGASPRASEDIHLFARKNPGLLLQIALAEMERFLSSRGEALTSSDYAGICHIAVFGRTSAVSTG